MGLRAAGAAAAGDSQRGDGEHRGAAHERADARHAWLHGASCLPESVRSQPNAFDPSRCDAAAANDAGIHRAATTRHAGLRAA